MFDSEVAGICRALARANRRDAVLCGGDKFLIFASGYQAALIDLLEAIRQNEASCELSREAKELVGSVPQAE